MISETDFDRLEDPDAEDVKQFIEEQRTLTQSILKKCDLKEKLRERTTALFDYPKYDCPFKRGEKYFYFHNTGLQAQSVLYIQVRGPTPKFCAKLRSRLVSGCEQ